MEDMAGMAGQMGYCDYVLFGKDGLPLAVVEAKRTSKDPNTGRKQAALYADCLERKFGRRPMMFTTNGFETYFWDDQIRPAAQSQRRVSARTTLQKLMNRRAERRDLTGVPIDDKITDRYYQKEAIRAVCGQIEQGLPQASAGDGHRHGQNENRLQPGRCAQPRQVGDQYPVSWPTAPPW